MLVYKKIINKEKFNERKFKNNTRISYNVTVHTIFHVVLDTHDSSRTRESKRPDSEYSAEVKTRVGDGDYRTRDFLACLHRGNWTIDFHAIPFIKGGEMNREILILLFFGICLLIVSIRAILVGIGKAKDPIRHMKQKSVKMLIQGIGGLVILICTSVYIVSHWYK